MACEGKAAKRQNIPKSQTGIEIFSDNFGLSFDKLFLLLCFWFLFFIFYFTSFTFYFFIFFIFNEIFFETNTYCFLF